MSGLTSPLVFALSGCAHLVAPIAERCGGDPGAFEYRHFPDGESYLRCTSDVRGRRVVLAASLDRPDERLVPALLAAATLRDLGATSVGLVAPYLPYMRQDQRFRDGEAVSSRYVGRLIERDFDWLVTVDPHLHRVGTLGEIFEIPTRAVSSAPCVAEWVAAHVDAPLLVGPDEESGQWVRAVAERLDAPFVVMEKERHGDRDVEVHAPDALRGNGHQAVVLDDIVSSGATVVEAIHQLARVGIADPACVCIHALFGDGAMELLAEATSGPVVSCDTVAHSSNAIPVAPVIAAAVAELV